MRAMLLYLEATRYKVQATLSELDGRARPSHPLASHIQVTRDRQGLQQSLLKIPQWAKMDEGDSPTEWCGREAGDGTSALPDSDFGNKGSIYFNNLKIKMKKLVGKSKFKQIQN